MPKAARAKELRPRRTAGRILAAAAVDGGVTPVAVMLHAMRRSWGIAQRYRRLGDELAEMAYTGLAAKHAAAVAPYCHSRLTTTVAADPEMPPVTRITYCWASAQDGPPEPA
ncbi:hypothetical protein [Lichenicoccus sp.]|uniref:hypothetical protein n=1 Tax=Lichenicoccus sp. TaxID=2781899 RepID=UPI003D0B09D6